MHKKHDLLISVVMITYNHKNFIRRAIESVLRQEAPFSFELVIGDDGSKDGTREICEELQRQYPDIIKYEYNDVNLGMNSNFLKTYNRCTGKYIAMLEGDDEWIDPQKLTKQVKILEENNDIVICYANANITDTKNPASNIYFTENSKPVTRKNHYELIEHCAVPTCTVLFRNKIIDIPDWWIGTKASAYFFFYLLSKKGDMMYYDEALSMYNHHYNGMSRRTNQKQMLYGDSLLGYKLVKYFDNDQKIYGIIINKNIIAINDLFHMGEFKTAIKLFWKLPWGEIIKRPKQYFNICKVFFKIHFLLFLSKKETKGVY